VARETPSILAMSVAAMPLSLRFRALEAAALSAAAPLAPVGRCCREPGAGPLDPGGALQLCEGGHDSNVPKKEAGPGETHPDLLLLWWSCRESNPSQKFP
jgi:hypothetical protein